tara:strand:- start:733 stop:1005 length:273 start_codon:yes stop_codon:yes gene_type:complete
VELVKPELSEQVLNTPIIGTESLDLPNWIEMSRDDFTFWIRDLTHQGLVPINSYVIGQWHGGKSLTSQQKSTVLKHAQRWQDLLLKSQSG